VRSSKTKLQASNIHNNAITLLNFNLTDVTRLNFFEVARAAFFSKYISPKYEVRSSARRTSPLTMVKKLKLHDKRPLVNIVILHILTYVNGLVRRALLLDFFT